jgi:hypothetical chaperone protein
MHRKEKWVCGIDFGTSNSSAGIARKGKREPVRLEGEQSVIPSAVFYPADGQPPSFGKAAITAYTTREEGRLLRSLKSILGNPLIEEATGVGGRMESFKSILGTFLGHLKERAETQAGSSIESVVLGRPVQFVDGDKKADSKAQAQLEEAAKAQGFRHIFFQYEPIAAALDYEQTITREQIALIADIGGGTSDFSIVRVSPERRSKPDRKADVLANAGVHVGGTDLDYRLSLQEVMPFFGYQTRQKKRPELEVPSQYYFDLARWHKIVFLYTRKVVYELKEVRHLAAATDAIDRLIKAVEHQEGHRIAGEVEAAKIRLSDADKTSLRLEMIEKGMKVPITRKAFEKAVADERGKITASVVECLARAGLKADKIDTLFLTGGSTAIPSIEAACKQSVPSAHVIAGDKFASVATGLTIDAALKFGAQATS